jgi:hypothetical protein
MDIAQVGRPEWDLAARAQCVDEVGEERRPGGPPAVEGERERGRPRSRGDRGA